MKKFAFSLERVLGYKRQVLDLLKNELAGLRAQVLELERRIDSGNREFDSTDRLLVDRMRSGTTPQNVSAYKRYLGELNRRVVALLQEKEKAEQAAAEKQEEVVRMNGEISALEHLRERQLAVYRAEERKELETQVEEFVSHARVRQGLAP